MANETAGGGAGVQVPETQGLVPRGGEGELAVGRDDNVRNKVVVAVEDALGVAVVGVIARQLPDDDGAVTRGGEEEVGVLLRGGNGGDPALVAGEGALVDERLRPVDAKSRVGWGQFCCSRECIPSAQIADDKGMLRMRNGLAQCRWWRSEVVARTGCNK